MIPYFKKISYIVIDTCFKIKEQQFVSVHECKCSKLRSSETVPHGNIAPNDTSHKHLVEFFI